MRLPSLPNFLLSSLLIISPLAVLASSGDRNPTYQHCLKGCQITYCDPSQPPVPFYLRVAGWDCAANCKYSCMHSFTDNIRSGGRWHQFYGKWPFYRLGPIQEPLSVLFSLGNLWVHYKGLQEVRRRVRWENGLRRWLEGVACVQINTWAWSAIFHLRDTPTTERLDYFSATLTISLSLLYTLLRVPSFITPLRSSPTRLGILVIAITTFLVISHFTYLLSFPLGSFPYGYHTAFNVGLATIHSLAWVLWSASFYTPLPTFNFNGRIISLQPYPPLDPTRSKSNNAATPLALVLLTTIAMSLELLDFPPIFRLLDAHALWHASTIPLAAAWWRFLTTDAIDLESAALGTGLPGITGGGMPLSGGASLSVGAATPKTPGMTSGFQAIAAGYPSAMASGTVVGGGEGGTRARSPGRTPGRTPGGKGDLEE